MCIIITGVGRRVSARLPRALTAPRVVGRCRAVRRWTPTPRSAKVLREGITANLFPEVKELGSNSMSHTWTLQTCRHVPARANSSWKSWKTPAAVGGDALQFIWKFNPRASLFFFFSFSRRLREQKVTKADINTHVLHRCVTLFAAWLNIKFMFTSVHPASGLWQAFNPATPGMWLGRF